MEPIIQRTITSTYSTYSFHESLVGLIPSQSRSEYLVPSHNPSSVALISTKTQALAKRPHVQRKHCSRRAICIEWKRHFMRLPTMTYKFSTPLPLQAEFVSPSSSRPQIFTSFSPCSGPMIALIGPLPSPNLLKVHHRMNNTNIYANSYTDPVANTTTSH